MTLTFAPHGEFSMRLTGRTLVIDHIGAFNKEGTQAMVAHARLLAGKAFDDGLPWAILSDMSHLELTTPDTLEIIEDLAPWFIEHGLAYEAIVAPGHIQRDNIKKLHAPIETLYDIAYFDTLAQANCWLRDKRML